MRRQFAEPQSFHQRIDAPRCFPLAQALLEGRRLFHFVGQHPEWFSLTPDGKTGNVAAAGDNQVYVVDVKTLKVVTKVNVGQVPKRNGTAIMQLAK